jgi:hypothetical protein
MAEGDIPSPGSTLMYFVLVSMGFLFFILFNINKSKSKEAVDSAKNSNIINFIYMLFIVIGSFFLNVHNSRQICSNNIEWNYILLITLVPWIVIFVLLYFILNLFPGWVSPFSNTIGYVFVSMLGVASVLKKILNSDPDPNSIELVKAINTINNNKSKFINQIDIDLTNFDKFIVDLKTSNIAKSSDDETILQLYKLITIKHVIGKLVWYILSGVLITSISYNLIIGMSCKKSVEQIIKDYNTANPR